MNPIHNILVIVDPTAERHPAVSKGALLAQRLDARMELFVCDTSASHQMRVAAQLREHPGQPALLELKPMLEQLARPLRERGIDVATEVDRSEPLHAALVDRVRRTSADLVIKDTHHHSLAQRTLLTNTDWHLIRECPLPLLLTKPRAWGNAPKVVAAVDPVHVNDKPAVLDHHILEHAALFAKSLAGELHLLYAYLPPSLLASVAGMGTVPPVMPTQAELARDAAQARALLADLVARYRIAAADTHLEVGGAAEVLPRVAGSLQADIIAMGAISRSGLKRIFIGSTAEAVLERLPCDALIVKPPNFTAMLPF